MIWYLVIAGRGGHPYVGLGGDAWPLDRALQSPLARTLHDRLMRDRQEVVLSGRSLGYLCVDNVAASEYYELAAVSVAERVALLEVSFGERAGVDGFDIGIVSGGYSIVESEVLVEAEAAPFRERLNARALFRSPNDAAEYLEARRGFERADQLETLDEYALCAIRILSQKEGD